GSALVRFVWGVRATVVLLVVRRPSPAIDATSTSRPGSSPGFTHLVGGRWPVAGPHQRPHQGGHGGHGSAVLRRGHRPVAGADETHDVGSLAGGGRLRTGRGRRLAPVVGGARLRHELNPRARACALCPSNGRVG